MYTSEEYAAMLQARRNVQLPRRRMVAAMIAWGQAMRVMLGKKAQPITTEGPTCEIVRAVGGNRKAWQRAPKGGTSRALREGGNQRCFKASLKGFKTGIPPKHQRQRSDANVEFFRDR
jgi:hypothetical protein